MLTLASWSSEPLSLSTLVDILLEYESRKQKVVVENSFQANLGDAWPNLSVAGAVRLMRTGIILMCRWQKQVMGHHVSALVVNKCLVNSLVV